MDGGFALGLGERHTYKPKITKPCLHSNFCGEGFTYVFTYVFYIRAKVLHLSLSLYLNIYIYDGICMVLFQKTSSLSVLLRGSDIYRKKLPVEVQMIYIYTIHICIYIYIFFTCMKRMVYIYSVHLLGEELEQWRLVT